MSNSFFVAMTFTEITFKKYTHIEKVLQELRQLAPNFPIIHLKYLNKISYLERQENHKR